MARREDACHSHVQPQAAHVELAVLFFFGNLEKVKGYCVR